MPVPNSMVGAAVSDLGLGDLLQQQVAGETDELRKKRISEQQQKQAMGPSGSMAVTSLFGLGGGVGGN